MLGLSRQKKPTLLTGVLVKQAKSKPNSQERRKEGVKLGAIFLLLVVVWLLAQPKVSTIGQGELSYQLAIPRDGRGKVELNLGPAGVAEFYTHKTPVGIKMNLVLGKDPTNNQTPEEMIKSITREFEPDAIREFTWFMATRIILLILLGMLIGVLISNGGGSWGKRMAWNAFDFGVIVIVATIIFSQVTYSTLDRSPKVKYTGYAAKYMPVILDIIRQPSGGFKIAAGSLDNSIGGMQTANRQAKRPRLAYEQNELTRILAISDVHDNFYGIALAESILDGDFGQFSAVLLTGDIADFGQAFEADLFKGFANRMRKAQIPVLYVNGNHESVRAMTEFEKLGFKSLNQQTAQVNGLELFGADDPQSISDNMASDEAVLEANSKSIAVMWSEFGSDTPQVMAVHDLAQAEAVIELAKQSKQELTVVFGHNHKTSAETDGTVNLIGCGTAGASGFRAVGDDSDSQYSYQILEFSQSSDPALVAVTTLEYKGLNESFTFTYRPVPIN